MKLIVGLGNPGPDYAGTRHNVGWRAVEEVARQAGSEGWRERFDAALAEVRLGREKVALLRPLTFMNRSGYSVRRAVGFWKLAPEDVLVVLDDLNLELGRVRVRGGGSDGGHNGLASVIEQLGTAEVPRLRLGIGPGPGGAAQVGFVLGRFAPEERPEADAMVARAADAARCWAREGLDEAMNRFNRRTETDAS